MSTCNYFPQKAVCDIGMQIFFVLFIKTDKTESLRPRIPQSFCQPAPARRFGAADWLGAPRQDLPPYFVKKRHPDSMGTSCSRSLRDGRDKI
jgi:hypothetical protein